MRYDGVAGEGTSAYDAGEPSWGWRGERGLTPTEGSALAKATHIVQQALTPVFILSGIGTLLNVFAARWDSLLTRPTRLRLRSRPTLFATAASTSCAWGGLTCATVLALFLGEMLGKAAAGLSLALFGGAILLTLRAIAGFAVEMLLAARNVRRAADDRIAEPGASAPATEDRLSSERADLADALRLREEAARLPQRSQNETEDRNPSTTASCTRPSGIWIDKALVAG